MEKKATTSCGCVVIRYIEDVPHVLLVRPFAHRDAWGIPKGHVDTGETFLACALRETREEAGIDVCVVDSSEHLKPVSTTYKNERKTVRAFLAYQQDPEAQPKAADGENVDIRYFKFTELPNIHVYQRSLLKEANERVEELGRERFQATDQEQLD